MDLNKLYYFYIVAKHEHVTHAAQELHLSQPALTKAVKQLEEDLGTTLITRHHRGIQLTACGRYLKTRLDSVFTVIDQLPDELSALRQETTQTIRLNVQVASIITTDAIVEYKALHKHVNFQVFKDKDFEHSDISITTDSGIAYTLPPPRKQTVIDEEICIAVPSDRFPGTDTLDHYLRPVLPYPVRGILFSVRFSSQNHIRNRFSHYDQEPDKCRHRYWILACLFFWGGLTKHAPAPCPSAHLLSPVDP